MSELLTVTLDGVVIGNIQSICYVQDTTLTNWFHNNVHMEIKTDNSSDFFISKPLIIRSYQNLFTIENKADVDNVSAYIMQLESNKAIHSFNNYISVNPRQHGKTYLREQLVNFKHYQDLIKENAQLKKNNKVLSKFFLAFKKLYKKHQMFNCISTNDKVGSMIGKAWRKLK